VSIVHERCQWNYEPDYVPVTPGRCECYVGIGTHCLRTANLWLYVADDDAEPTATIWACDLHAADWDAFPMYGDTVRLVLKSRDIAVTVDGDAGHPECVIPTGLDYALEMLAEAPTPNPALCDWCGEPLTQNP
jgi:hypothetical protein